MLSHWNKEEQPAHIQDGDSTWAGASNSLAELAAASKNSDFAAPKLRSPLGHTEVCGKRSHAGTKRSSRPIFRVETLFGLGHQRYPVKSAAASKNSDFAAPELGSPLGHTEVRGKCSHTGTKRSSQPIFRMETLLGLGHRTVWRNQPLPPKTSTSPPPNLALHWATQRFAENALTLE